MSSFPTMICLGIHGYPIFRHILRSRPASDAHQRIAVRVRAEPFGHLFLPNLQETHESDSRTMKFLELHDYHDLYIIYKQLYIYIYDFIYDYIYIYMIIYMIIYIWYIYIYGSFHKWWYPQWMISWFSCNVDPSRPHVSKRDPAAPALCSRARSLGASTFRFSWQLILSLHGNLKRTCKVVPHS